MVPPCPLVAATATAAVVVPAVGLGACFALAIRARLVRGAILIVGVGIIITGVGDTVAAVAVPCNGRTYPRRLVAVAGVPPP